MKKAINLISVILVTVVLFSFGSCAKKTALVTLLCDKKEISAGDTFTVTVHMNECEKVACFQYELTGDENLIQEEKEQLDVGEFTVFENEDGNLLTIAGMVATVYNVSGMDIYSITYKIPETVEAGTKLKVKLVAKQFMTGIDENGDETEEHCKNIPVSEISIKVK